MGHERSGILGRRDGLWLLAALAAGALLAAALFLPLWKMEMVAPQYPEGLVMYAYGHKFSDDPSSPYLDVREINGLNHYIGMKPIEEVTEMQLFVPAVIALIASAVAVSFVAWKRRWVQGLFAAAFWFMPLFFVADLQYWLYHYGHSMDPEAPLNPGAFTPKVLGSTKVWNFHSNTSFEIGFYLMVAAAVVITALPPGVRWLRGRRARSAPARAERPVPHPARSGRGLLVKALLLAALVAGGAAPLGPGAAQGEEAGPPQGSLQQRIDRAAPGDTVYVDGGVFREHLVIDKAVSLVGRGQPVIDGGGEGDVVTISVPGASLSGFVVRGSGRSISQEPAAIKVAEVDGVTVSGNRVEDAHFGIHLLGSAGSTVSFNEVILDADVPIGRRGHGIYVWEVSHSVVHGNTVRNASDGIHLEFSEGNGIGENIVSDSRYALHLMYSDGNKITNNTFRDNLAGAVLMFSHDLLVKGNELASNRKGATGVGMLFKDCDNVFVEGNRLFRNKFGMTVEGTPQTVGTTAVFMRNLFALNDTGVGVMSNAPITFVENAMIDNTVQVKALGGELASRVLSGHGGGMAGDHEGAVTPDAVLPEGAAWTSDGRGNYWSDYRGYDGDGDGVGDRPYRPEPPFAGRLADNDTLRLFQFTLAQQAIDMAADMFPLYRYDPVMEDAGPLMSAPAGLSLSGGGSFNRELMVVSVALVVLAAFFTVRVLELDAGRALRRALSRTARGPLGGGTRA